MAFKAIRKQTFWNPSQWIALASSDLPGILGSWACSQVSNSSKIVTARVSAEVQPLLGHPATSLLLDRV